jgi:hypothetical protein
MLADPFQILRVGASMNPANFPNLDRLRKHDQVEVIVISKKSFGLLQINADQATKMLIIRKIDASLSIEKLEQLEQEGRIAFLLDGKKLQLTKSYADKHLCEHKVCRLQFKQKNQEASNDNKETPVAHEDPFLENVEVVAMSAAEYAEIIEICREILKQKADADQSEIEKRTFKAKAATESPLRLALKDLLMQTFTTQMNDVTRRVIEIMREAREEEAEQAKVASEKERITKEKLLAERLLKERLQGQVKSNEVKATVQKQRDEIIPEHLA